MGLKSSYTIIDVDDQERLIKQLLEAENIDPNRWTPRHFAGLVDHWKNRGWIPSKLPAAEGATFANNRGQALYAVSYRCDRLRVLNACDFGDLLLHNLTIFTQHPDVLADFHNRFKYILVDEYQDSNVAQYLWLRLLAQAREGGRQNLCCVGDDDQSIYGWRGAEVDNILRFERDFPGAKVVRLERNYRSTAHILAAASGLFPANKGRLGKTLWTEAEGGQKVKVRGVWDGEAESRMVADEIERWVKTKRRYRECAILVRASFQMRAFEERFVMLQIPYQVIGGPRFFERAEIRDAHAYLRLIQSEDDDLAFERIVNVPKRGIGDTTVQKLHQRAAVHHGAALRRRRARCSIAADRTGRDHRARPAPAAPISAVLYARRRAKIACAPTSWRPAPARRWANFLRDHRQPAGGADSRHHAPTPAPAGERSWRRAATPWTRSGSTKGPTSQTRLDNLKELRPVDGQRSTPCRPTSSTSRW